MFIYCLLYSSPAKNTGAMRKPSNFLGYCIAAFLLLNLLASQFFYRFDFTQDQRYSLSETSISLIDQIEQPLAVEVYLTGDLPSVFKQLQLETRYLFEEYQAYNPKIKFTFIDPLDTKRPAEEVANIFYQRGMTPERLNMLQNGKTIENWIFPYAEVNMGGKQIQIPLLQKKLGASNEELVSRSIQNLEYQITNALVKLTRQKEKKVAVLRGKGQLEDAYIADYIKELGKYYRIAPFTLETLSDHPNETLTELQKFDLIIDAKPTEQFTDAEKYCLDQFIMNGGKAIWLTEQVMAEKDSLIKSGSTMAFPKQLDRYDLFFTYGIRINASLVNDLYSAPIVLAQGQGNQTQFNPFPWFYEPLADEASKHPIVGNLNAVHFNFANPIEFLERKEIQQTPLLKSSDLTRLEGTPREIKLDQIQEEVNPESYRSGPQILAALLEGEFTSLYFNRLLPFQNDKHIDKSKFTQQVVISDGDVIKNELVKGQVMELGFDRYTGNTYGNKDFLLNTANYLLGDEDLVKLRSKSIKLPILSQEKIEASQNAWKTILLVGGLFIFGIISFLFSYLRKRAYT
jgi:gliding-associated putative ABC transporter substrate-binding component GldG